MTRLTVAGHVIGTMAYIAPEQIKGQRVDETRRTEAAGLANGQHSGLSRY